MVLSAPLRGLLLLVAALASCAEPGLEEPAQLRLSVLALPSAALEEAPAPPPARPLFTADFSTLSPWRVLRSPGATAAPVASFPEEEGRRFLRLEGELGALHLAVPVEPGAGIILRGELRARELETLPRPFRGATFWVGEARDERALEQLLGGGEARFVRTHSVPSRTPDGSWHRDELAFVCAPETRMLHVLCVLSQDQELAGGQVDFRALELESFAPEGFARTALTRAQARRAASEAPQGAWQRARQLGSELGGEFRPGFVLLPGDRLTLQLPPLEGDWRLELGLGPWRPGELEGRAGSGTLRVRSGRTQVPHATPPAPGATPDTWLPLALGLDGEAETLEFELTGTTPVAIGAPTLVRTDAHAPRTNVLLVSIDTLRADHVGPRADGSSLTPTLDRLAARGLLAADTSAVSPYTLPSHTTMLTGQLPSVHGVVAHESRLSAARSATLAERLTAEGYATRAFTAGGFVNPEFGLDRGFAAFSTVDPIRAEGSHFARTLATRLGEGEAARQLEAHGFAGVKRFLAAHTDTPFFLFLHTYAVHDYDAPEEYLDCKARGCARPSVPLRTRTEEEAAAFTPEMRAHVRHLYEAALRYTDARLGELVAELERLGLAENTLVLVTSDHGEEFFEHGHLQHGMTLHEEILRVPLILAGPGVPARRLARPAQLADVAPTLLARLGLAPLPSVQGVDLLGPDWPQRFLWAEVDDRFVQQYSLRTEDGAKTLHAPSERRRMYPRPKTWEHYELARDPHEQEDLWPAGALDARARLLGAERERLEALGAELGAAGSGELDASTAGELEDLGYGD